VARAAGVFYNDAWAGVDPGRFTKVAIGSILLAGSAAALWLGAPRISRSGWKGGPDSAAAPQAPPRSASAPVTASSPATPPPDAARDATGEADAPLDIAARFSTSVGKCFPGDIPPLPESFGLRFAFTDDGVVSRLELWGRPSDMVTSCIEKEIRQARGALRAGARHAAAGTIVDHPYKQLRSTPQRPVPSSGLRA
jgi:hypothetical protein